MNAFAPKIILRIAALLALLAAAGWASAADQPKPSAQPAPKEPVSAERIDKLINQLGDKDYYVRQHAQEELGRLGFEAFDALSAAAANEDLEIASRARYLLRVMRVGWAAESDPPEVKKCLRDYEFEDARSRVATMQDLARLPNAQGITALCRLVRFEQSPVLSKRAAVEILRSQSAGAQAPALEAVRDVLRPCKRPGAVWLRAWIRLEAKPDDAEAMAAWTKLIDEEQALLRRAANESAPEIVAGLIRFQVARLKQLGKTGEATAAIHRLVEVARGDPETLGELLHWLAEQKAWKAIDDLARRFTGQIQAEPGLMYALAQAYVEQGLKDKAEESAARALRLFPGKQQQQLLRHLMVAQQLRQQGQFVRARREFEHVVKQGVDAENDELRAMAQSALAEMLHDQGQDLDAGEVLQKLVEAIDAGKVTEAELGGRKSSEVRSRMLYFMACHWEAKHDAAKQREYLDKALKAEPTDVDVLIACYRLAGPPEHHAKIVELIRKAAAVAREQIAEDPEGPSGYNQFAWLIGNTEGDFDEALKYSLKSVELKPDEGGLYDTLARVYFAKGDLDNAVKQQTKAAELDPHSGLIRRQLEFFRKTREERKKP